MTDCRFGWSKSAIRGSTLKLARCPSSGSESGPATDRRAIAAPPSLRLVRTSAGAAHGHSLAGGSSYKIDDALALRQVELRFDLEDLSKLGCVLGGVITG
jgi:hypothetical protein